MKAMIQRSKWAFLAMVLPYVSFAQEGAAAAHTAGGSLAAAMPLAVPLAALAIGLAAFGGALGQGKIAAAFMEGVSRNPQAVNLMKTQLILCLVLVETLVLFTLLISLLVVFKLVF